MDNAHLQRILTIADIALSLESQKRQDYLTEVCGDEGLRNDVQALLESMDASERFWEEWQNWNDDQIQQLLQEPVKDVEEPGQIGPWRLIKLLGRGGMGSVYLAERADGQYEQQAAVKVLQQGLEHGESFRRFEQERQILARLDHPGIARLYDGGTTHGGRPWLAMQYVDGVSITRWCRQHDCSLSQRLALFHQVCEAVRYAHKNLIVHRDLKPENILVTEDGRVRILDFGIAKLLDRELTKEQRIHTQTGLRVMSLDYAAPEQFTGEPITTATDVYALGLLLYELLTTIYPFNLEGQNQRQIEQILRDQDPEKPSSIAVRWQAELRGDLDAITLKALRKEPDRRYENAGQLLDDLQRYQGNLPVGARRDTVRYRMSKLYKRHRGKLVSTAVVVLGVVGLIAYYTVQVTRERNTAREETAKSKETSSFLEELFNTSDPFIAVENGRPDTMQVRFFLKRGADKVQRELENQPVVQAHMLNIVGDVYINLGLFDEALPLLKQALSIRRKVGPPIDIAVSLEALGRAFQRKGDFKSAEQHYREALNLRRKKQGEQNTATARTMVMLAVLLDEKSAFNESETLLQQALTIQRTQMSEIHPDVAETLRQLGILFHRRAELDQAEFYYRKSLSINRKLYDKSSLKVAQSLLNLATLLREKGEYAEAEPPIREVLKIRQHVLGKTHPLTLTSMYELAIFLRDKKEPQFEQAAGLFQRVIELDRKELGETHYYVGLNLFELGITFSKMGALDKAEQAYRQSLAVLRQALPEGHPDIALALTGLGDTLIKEKKPEKAEPLLREGLQIRRNKLGEQGWRTGVSESALGWAIMMQGRYEEAEPLLIEGYHILQESDGPTRAALKRLVILYEHKGDTGRLAVYRKLLTAAKY